VTAAALRQSLHRARLMFAQLLLDELSQWLPAATADEMKEELIALGLLK
jgi:hypothetical protein